MHLFRCIAQNTFKSFKTRKSSLCGIEMETGGVGTQYFQQKMDFQKYFFIT